MGRALNYTKSGVIVGRALKYTKSGVIVIVGLALNYTKSGVFGGLLKVRWKICLGMSHVLAQ